MIFENLYIDELRALRNAVWDYGFQLGRECNSTVALLLAAEREAQKRGEAKVTVTIPYSKEEAAFMLNEAYNAMLDICRNLGVSPNHERHVEKFLSNRGAFEKCQQTGITP